MATALTALKHIQISNVEDPPGSAEEATEIILDSLMSTAYGDKVIHYPEQDRNSLSANLADDFIVGRQANLSMEGVLNDRLACYILSNSIRGNISPTQPGGGEQPNYYRWEFEPGITTGNTPDITDGIDTFTIEYGDNVQSYETEYCFTESFSFTGAPNEPVMYTWDIIGRQITESVKTNPLSIATRQQFISNKTRFYIDTSWAGMGGTQKTGMLLGWTWTYETGFTARYAFDNTLYFSGVNEAKKRTQLELTYLRGSDSESEKNKYDNRTTTYLIIQPDATTELDSGKDNPPRLTLKGAFRYTDWPETDDADGAQTITVSAESVYDSSGGKEITILANTLMSTFPA